MDGNVQIILLTFVGIFLLWFGYSLFTHFGSKMAPIPDVAASNGRRLPEGIPGAPRTCPLCSILLQKGERVRSKAFPSMGGKERLMHVMGCPYCLDGPKPRRRVCPVCGGSLNRDEFLVARLFDRPGRSHVHVLGCTRCRGPHSAR